jgi:hypothetical protein
MEKRKWNLMEVDGLMVQAFKEAYKIYRVYDALRDEIKALVEAGELELKETRKFVAWFYEKPYTEYRSKKGTWIYVIDLHPEMEDETLIVFEIKKQRDSWLLEKTLRAYKLLLDGYNWFVLEKNK